MWERRTLSVSSFLEAGQHKSWLTQRHCKTVLCVGPEGDPVMHRCIQRWFSACFMTWKILFGSVSLVFNACSILGVVSWSTIISPELYRPPLPCSILLLPLFLLSSSIISNQILGAVVCSSCSRVYGPALFFFTYCLCRAPCDLAVWTANRNISNRKGLHHVLFHIVRFHFRIILTANHQNIEFSMCSHFWFTTENLCHNPNNVLKDRSYHGCTV